MVIPIYSPPPPTSLAGGIIRTQRHSSCRNHHSKAAKVKVFSKEGQLQGRGHKSGNHVKGLVARNVHVQYESPVPSGKKVMDKAKVFVHASHADADVDNRAILAPRTFILAR